MEDFNTKRINLSVNLRSHASDIGEHPYFIDSGVIQLGSQTGVITESAALMPNVNYLSEHWSRSETSAVYQGSDRALPGLYLATVVLPL